MVLTDVIIPPANFKNAKIFNILSETLENEVRLFIRRIRENKGSEKSIEFNQKESSVTILYSQSKKGSLL